MNAQRGRAATMAIAWPLGSPELDMCGIFGVHGHARRGRARRSSGCTRCSIAARSRRGRRRSTSDGVARSRAQRWDSCPRMRVAGARRRSRARSRSDTRATARPARRRSRTRSRCSRVRAAATSRSRTTATSTNAGELRRELEDRRLDLLVDDGLRGHRAPSRAIDGAATPAERLADALHGRRGRVQPDRRSIGDTLLAARDPRGWRPLVMGRLGDSLRLRLGDVRARHRRRDDRARGRARRDRRRRRAAAFTRAFPLETKELKRCVFEYVYFARPDSRVFGGSVDRARRALGRQLAKEHPAPGAELVFCGSRLVELRGARLRRSKSGLPFELALIRNHYVGRTFIQPTQARSRRQGEGEVQPGARGARGKERRDGRRLDRARHDDARTRRARARRRRARGAHARQLAADHRARATTASTRRRGRS